MKIISLVLVFLLSSVLAKAQVSFGSPEKIDDGWKFSKGDIKEASQPGFDDAKWRTVDLPHDWSIEGRLSPCLASATGYLPGGIAWYRKALDIPADKKDEKIYIYFEGVYDNAEVFINGHSLGIRPNGYVSYMYELTPYIQFGGKTRLLYVWITANISIHAGIPVREYTGM